MKYIEFITLNLGISIGASIRNAITNLNSQGLTWWLLAIGIFLLWLNIIKLEVKE